MHVDEVYMGGSTRKLTVSGLRLDAAGRPISYQTPLPAKLTEEQRKRRYGTGVDDRVIEPLMAFTSAKRITFDRTKVTAEGIQPLRQALPRTEIVVIEPEGDP